MRIGVHVSAAGHIYEAVNRARALGVTTMQLFSRDPRQWRKARLSLEDIEVKWGQVYFVDIRHSK